MRNPIHPLSLTMTVILLVLSSFFVSKRNYSQTVSHRLAGITFPTNIIKDNISAPAEESSIYDSLDLDKAGLNRDAFDIAWKGYNNLLEKGELENKDVLSIIDFTQPSNRKRLYIIDVARCKLLIQTFVAHGKNSGLQYARQFSNQPESNKSSIGFYKTLSTYLGDHGLALKLEGLERNFNDHAYERSIVVHGSDYVNTQTIRGVGHLGRSLGCPAVPMNQHKAIINTIKNGSCLFIYYPLKEYLKKSALINS